MLGVGHVDELGMNTAQDESPAQQRKGLNRRWGVWEADTQNGRSKREGVSEAQDPSVRTADDTPTPEPCCELEGVDRKGRKAAPTGTTTLSAQTSEATMHGAGCGTGDWDGPAKKRGVGTNQIHQPPGGAGLGEGSPQGLKEAAWLGPEGPVGVSPEQCTPEGPPPLGRPPGAGGGMGGLRAQATEVLLKSLGHWPT